MWVYVFLVVWYTYISQGLIQQKVEIKFLLCQVTEQIQKL